MSNRETIIQHVQAGTPQNGWVVFRFNATSTWLAIAWQIFAIGVLAMATNMFLFMPVTIERTQENYLFGYGAAFIGALFIIALLFSLRKLVMAKKTYLVITDELLIKSFCGKIEEYPISAISKLHITQLRGTSGFKPRYMIEFVDTRTHRIELLAEKRFFGDEPAIFSMLKSKL